eukprot:XP_001690942.1 predicted protein [Chlamydomonas reinhardtii]
MQGLQQVLSSAPLRTALDRLCDQPVPAVPAVPAPSTSLDSTEEQQGGDSGAGESSSGAEGHAASGTAGAGLAAAAGGAAREGIEQALDPQPDALAREARSVRRTLAALAKVMGMT